MERIEHGFEFAEVATIRERFGKFLSEPRWQKAYEQLHPPLMAMAAAPIVLTLMGQPGKVGPVIGGARARGFRGGGLVKRYQRLAERGVPMVAMTLMRNAELARGRIDSAPAMVCGAFDDPLLRTVSPDNQWLLKAIGIGGLPIGSDEEKSYHKFARDQQFKLAKRHRVPDSIAPGRDAWLFHVNIVVDFLANPGSFLYVCLVDPGASGMIAVIPPEVYEP